MEPKEIESLSYVGTMVACGSLMKELMLVYLVLLLQLNYLMGSMKVVVHQLMVMACWAQVVASNDCAYVVVNAQDDDVIIRFQDDPNDATVTDDSREGADYHGVMVQVETFDEVRLDDFQKVSMLHTVDFLGQVQTHFHLTIMKY